MKNNFRIFILLLVCFLNRTCFNQVNLHESLKSFKCEYEDSSIKIIVSTYKLFINKNDSLSIKITFSNKLKDTLLLYTKTKYTYTLGDKKDIIIDVGGTLSFGLDTPIDMKILRCGSTDSLFVVIPDNYLSDKSFSEYFNVAFSIGYVSELAKMRANQYKSNIKIEKISKDILRVSSLVLSTVINILEISTFNFYRIDLDK